MGNMIHIDRNFFGVVKILDSNSVERIMISGTTDHGRQALDEELRLKPISYYSKSSPMADVYRFYGQKTGDQNVAVIGLGAGSVACYQKDGRHFDFYEIDPKIIKIAEDETLFTFLRDCGSSYNIIVGDGRMTIAEEQDGSYDIILVDAFSSDNIPVHVMTKEAIELYLSKLKESGTLMLHISNNYLDLEPVVARTAEDIGIPHLARLSNSGTMEGTDIQTHSAHVIILTRNENFLKELADTGWTPGMLRDGVKGWSDQYSNIISILGRHSSTKRFKATQEKERAE